MGVVNWSLGEGIDMFEMRLLMLVDGGVDMLANLLLLLFNTAIGEGSDGIEREVDSFVLKWPIACALQAFDAFDSIDLLPLFELSTQQLLR